MKVILVQDVTGLGEEGEARDVAKGYARNYLFPKGYAVEDTPFNRNRMKEQQKKIELRKVRKREEAQKLAEAGFECPCIFGDFFAISQRALRKI